MKIYRLLPLLIFLLASCGISNLVQDGPQSAIVPSTIIPTKNESSKLPLAQANIHVPSLNTTWQIQYSGEIDTDLPVDVYNLDLFDTDAAVVTQLHDRGIFVMCYFSAGSFEDWRLDSKQFPPEILGNNMAGWPGEKWLDIRRIDLLAPIMEARLELAIEKGCDGVDPDNVNGYTNNTGFLLSNNNQLAFNIFLSNAAHERGLSIGLKNDLEQIPDLVSYFEWALNEECFSYDDCNLLLPFIEAGKPVFVIEYNITPEEFCSQANDMNFNALQKNLELDAFRFPCR